MLKEMGINLAAKLGIDDQLRSACSPLFRSLKRDRIDGRNLRLLLAFGLREDSNCIDIGAHKGAVLAEIMRVAPRGKHIAYEPLPFLHKYLVNQFPSVDVRLAAASNEVGEALFTHVKNLPTMSGFRERAYPVQPQIERLNVRTETLDESLPPGYVPALIKIDVEGAERLVIEGAIETISVWKPIVVFEHGKLAADHYDTQASQVYELLHDAASLRIFDLDGNGPFTLSQFEETIAHGEHWNFVAHP